MNKHNKAHTVKTHIPLNRSGIAGAKRLAPPQLGVSMRTSVKVGRQINPGLSKMNRESNYKNAVRATYK